MPDNKKRTPATPGLLARLRKIVGLNIGTIMFGVLFLYMAFSAILYMTTTHIESYQVTSGPLSRNETYTGLAIREESVYTADSSGYITYYAREGSKINASGAVYGLNSTKAAQSSSQLSQEQLSKIRSDMMSFSKSFNRITNDLPAEVGADIPIIFSESILLHIFIWKFVKRNL